MDLEEKQKLNSWKERIFMDKIRQKLRINIEVGTILHCKFAKWKFLTALFYSKKYKCQANVIHFLTVILMLFMAFYAYTSSEVLTAIQK